MDAVTQSPGVTGYVVAAQAFSWFDSNFNLSSGTPQLRQSQGTQLLLQHGLFWGQTPGPARPARSNSGRGSRVRSRFIHSQQCHQDTRAGWHQRGLRWGEVKLTTPWEQTWRSWRMGRKTSGFLPSTGYGTMSVAETGCDNLAPGLGRTVPGKLSSCSRFGQGGVQLGGSALWSRQLPRAPWGLHLRKGGRAWELPEPGMQGTQTAPRLCNGQNSWHSSP